MFKRFFFMAKAWWASVFITVFALIAAAGLNLVTPELIRRMTAILADPEALTYKTLTVFTVILAASYLLRALFKFLAMWQAHVAAWEFVADLTGRVYEKLQKLSMSYFSHRETGEVMSRAINDTRSLELLFAHSLPDMFSNTVILLSVSVMIFVINPLLALLTLIPLPIVFIVSLQFSKRVAPLFRINAAFLAKLNSHFAERISGIKEIQAFGREEDENGQMKELCREYARVNIHANFVNAIYHPSVEAVISMGTVIVMGIGGVFAMRNTVTAADIVGFFIYLSMFYQPLSTLARIAEDIQSARAGGERVLEVLDMPVEVEDGPDAVDIGKADGEIEFRNVSFGYGNGETVLDGVSFKVSPGEMIALVGATGVGKSTAISLIERFYDTESGEILLDGKNIRSLTLDSLRRNISIVLQDVFLFSGTVYDNIAYGRYGATRDEVYRAARIAKAEEFILALPNGYETEIGERGTRLSGGQKQRLAIARAMLKDAPILIFDEATSSVDNETEADIQHAIEDISKMRTVIVIAHRLSTVRQADRIIVLKEGRIAESGSHTELIRQNGIYARMCQVNDEKIAVG